MLKLRVQWKLETGEEFNEWTKPIELSLVETEFYKNQPLVTILRAEGQVSNVVALFLAHKMQQRITKKVENFDNWKTKVTDIAVTEFETANFTKPEVLGEQQ